jgi:uroporphyrinogen decarboxylase
MEKNMTGRERVRAALTFNRPDRVPRDLWALPYVTLFEKESFDAVIQKYPMDIGTSQLSPGWSDKVIKASASAGSYVDDWGSEWHVGEPGVVGEVRKPVLYDWDNLKSFQPPWNLIRKRDLSYANKSCEESDKFMLSDVTARPFERLQFLRGTENLFMDIAYDAAEMRKLLEMVHEFYLEDVRQWCASSVDAVFLMDDWGTNRSLLIDPKVWRALFKPLYKEYCDMIHSAGKFAFFHTDGNTESIFGDLVEVGMDAINSQLFVMDIEELSRKYKGKVTFWGEVDRQHALPFGTKEEVQRAVRRVKEVLDDGTGGVIAQCEWGKQNPRQNIETVFETWQDGT